jgi:protein-S-isoprenylcysteine O-methyltransferase Ste14
MSTAPIARLTFPKAAARVVQLAAFFVILGGILFIAAGRLDWWEAWIFLAVYFVITVAGQLWVMYRDPELSQERSRVGPNAKRWDKIIIAVNGVLTLALFVLIGLDAGRFKWSALPLGVRFLGGFGFIASICLTLWASYVNTYLSGQVRIQAERGHHAITAGPYRYVRHPMYLGMMLYDFSLPLLLGSGWALIVSVLMVILVVIRTILEDRTLQAELPGYAEYARQTRYRLVPGVW